MRDGPAHVEASGRRPSGRVQPSCRSPTPRPSTGMSRGHLHRLLRRYREGGLDALEPRSRRPMSNPRRTPESFATGSSSCAGAHRRRVSTPGRSRSPGISRARAGRPRRRRRSAGSSMRRAWSRPSRANARAAPRSASRRLRPTRCGSPTSPTGAWPTAATSRSSTGSTTTPAVCWPARPTPVTGDDVVATFLATGDPRLAPRAP